MRSAAGSRSLGPRGTYDAQRLGSAAGTIGRRPLVSAATHGYVTHVTAGPERRFDPRRVPPPHDSAQYTVSQTMAAGHRSISSGEPCC